MFSQLRYETASYCHPQETAYASGDQLYYLINDGWTIIHANQELYLRNGRRVRVFVFALYRDRDVIEVSVVSTPVVMRFAQRYLKYTQHINDFAQQQAASTA